MFDTYWRFAAKRQAVYEDRSRGLPGPWTDDAILARHRFTNCFRASDRVSQFLIKHVIYSGSMEPGEVLFRVMLFKFFNRIETWTALTAEFGELTTRDFNIPLWSSFLIDRSLRRPIYSAAYVIPQPPFGAPRKATNHLLLLERMVDDDLAGSLRDSSTMEEAYRRLRAYPGLGDFLAYQFLIDLNYSPVLDFDEMDFVVAGPGAKDGIRKCFGSASSGHETTIIRYVAETQEEHFSRLGLSFEGLQGLRPLMLVDCQNLFCETDKYARVAHPDVRGRTKRARIKQLYRPSGPLEAPWFPPKWGINGA
ncbi:nucleotide kinase domain-containing protein [Intrasporangium sp. YIM S08009]|uniref:nucleotide kinase domain-containing protein n=1 Tax=Intrasporangium zincisolvens TaxID=3080018 RepID=UPI002B05D29A|nr:nucleotide kinase domain-containing protein [Intrasporangium sp. YIM S08009]